MRRETVLGLEAVDGECMREAARTVYLLADAIWWSIHNSSSIITTGNSREFGVRKSTAGIDDVAGVDCGSVHLHEDMVCGYSGFWELLQGERRWRSWLIAAQTESLHFAVDVEMLLAL